MNLITKYKIFETENKNIFFKKNILEKLIDEYLLNDLFFDFFNKYDIFLEKKYRAYIYNDNFYIEIMDSVCETVFTVNILDYKEICEIKFFFKIKYNEYILYEKYVDIDFLIYKEDITDNIKEYFINLNKDIISTPFKSTKKEVDDLENFMDVISLKTYLNDVTVYISRNALVKYREVKFDKDNSAIIPDEFEYLKNIKLMQYIFSPKYDTIYLYANLHSGAELVEIHEQYIKYVYKIYKKIANI